MPMFSAINSFNAGELSPKMVSRTDVSQYHKGCRLLRNFLVTPYGAADRRPGTKFIAAAKFADNACRLIPFAFSSSVAYVCEFGERYIRFFRDNIRLELELESPYTADELADLQFVQSADVMTIVHPAHPVMELRRIATADFELVDKAYEYPPMLEPNLDDEHTLTPSATTGDITLAASKDTFSDDHAGAFFQLIHTRKENEISLDFTADGTSDAIEVRGYWTFTTHGTWTGTITLQRSFDNGTTWQDYRTYSSANDSNTSTSGEEEEDDVLYRLKMDDYAASSSGTLKLCRCLFVNPDFVTTGVVRITKVKNKKEAEAHVERKLGAADATHEWNEGAWSDVRGYPRAVAYYEERMVFAGTDARKQTVWASKTGDWDNFLLGTRDDDALAFTLASDTVNTIVWMCQHDALVIGTMDSEWTLSASDTSAALTPSNFKVRRQSVYGSRGIPALMVGDTILFVQRGGRKVREFAFQWERDGYTSPDLTILAEHITLSGIVAAALQRLPDSILWCILADGTAAALTYERDQEVVGWHKHTTQGRFASVCVIPDGAADRVYFAVERDGVMLIEMLTPRTFDSIADAFYVDSGIHTAAASPMTEVHGLDHLEGQTVQVLADGAVQSPKTVTDGAITLDSPAKDVVAGLAFTSILSPMPIDLDGPTGSTVSHEKTIAEIRIRASAAVGGEARAGYGHWERIPARDVLLDNMDAAITPKDDIFSVFPRGGFDRDAIIEIRQTEPLPINIHSIVSVMHSE